MKRTIALVMAALLMVGMLAGCGVGGNDKNENGQTVISVGNWPTKEGKDLTNMESRKTRFEEINTDVVVEPDPWKFDRRTFYAKAAGGQLPTVYMAGYTEMPEIIATDLSADLTKVLKKRGYEGMLNEKILEIVSKDGEIRALPKNAYLLGLAFNAELLAQAGFLSEDGTPHQPKDWFELAEMAAVIKEKTGKPGLVLPTAGNNGGWIFTSIAWSFGVDFMEKDADGNWKATFNTPEAIEAMQWYRDLKWKYDVLPPNTMVDGADWDKTMGVGNAAMTIAAGADISRRVVKYGLTPDKVGIMVIPAGPKRHVTMLGGDVQALKPEATADQIDAGIRWYETENSFNLTEEYQKTVEETVETQLSNNQHVGIQGISIWSNDAPSVAWYNQYLEEHTNGNPNHVKLYNEFVKNPTCEIQPEEPVACQELYKILDSIIQEIMTNENADIPALLEKGNNDFQTNYLNNL